MAVTERQRVELTPETLLAMYERMVLIRVFEETTMRQFADGPIPGFVHLYAGEEAVAVGVCTHLSDADFITSTHRGHGHCIAKGVDVDRDGGRADGPADRHLQGQGRLDARRRHREGHARRERHRRRRHPAGLRRGADREDPRHRRGHDLLLRRRRVQPGDVPRERSTWRRSGSCRSCSSARTTATPRRPPFELPLLGQATSPPRAPGYDIPGVIVDGLDPLAMFAAAGEAIDARPARRRTDADRGEDVPLLRPRRGRRRHLPHGRGGRGAPRADPLIDVRRPR